MARHRAKTCGVARLSTQQGVVALAVVLLQFAQFPGATGSPAATDVLSLSLKFYEAQQSGNLATWNRLPWKNSSHTTDGSSSSGATSDFYPGVDLSGGWYSGGGHVKVSLSTGAAASLLALTGLSYYNSLPAETLAALENHVGWAAAYLDKCYYASDKFVAQIGDTYTDDRYWGRPERQVSGGDEGSESWRPVYTIDTDEGRGADVLSQAAATLAAYATLLSKSGGTSSSVSHYRDRAVELWNIAKDLEGVYIIPEGNLTLLSRSYRDDQAWAAAWLCRYQIESGDTSLSTEYCDTALAAWYDMTSVRGSQLYMSADTMHVAVAAFLRDSMGRDSTRLTLNTTLLAKLNAAIDAAYSWWNPSSPTTCSCADIGICKTSGGFMVLQEYASAHFTANIAMLALLTARYQPGLGASNQLPNQARYARRCWAHGQIDYLLGGKTGQAFVVGLSSLPGVDAGVLTPKRPRHRTSSCDKASGKCHSATVDNMYELQGALVGGPLKDDSYTDSRNSFQSLVSIEYNAGLVGALAGLSAMESAMSLWANPSGGQYGGWGDYCTASRGYGNSILMSTGVSSTTDCSFDACADTSKAELCGLRYGSFGAQSLSCGTLFSADMDAMLAITDGIIFVTARPSRRQNSLMTGVSGGNTGLTLRGDGQLVLTQGSVKDVLSGEWVHNEGELITSQWAALCAACTLEEDADALGTANAPFALSLYLNGFTPAAASGLTPAAASGFTPAAASGFTPAAAIPAAATATIPAAAIPAAAIPAAATVAIPAAAAATIPTAAIPAAEAAAIPAAEAAAIPTTIPAPPALAAVSGLLR
ncbi:hypothetical protein GPECTOR_24g220 [Gonium pectorale]|uniref:cellulase n=1 Tax=Gonium pectorale TaxID=33097 RepID=A0A150GHV1_GONPE|nr:hypothetical protein GPECTOR_24g220 [Gonium pectorale]|eukprot:KXZ48930.1 hypothetical protein GPECTOR_24g220 [Gonium pectorale]